MRVRVSGEYGFILMSFAAIGIFYWICSFIVESILLSGHSEEEKDAHVLSKVLFWITTILVIANILLVVLPVLGIELLPFTLLDFL